MARRRAKVRVHATKVAEGEGAPAIALKVRAGRRGARRKRVV
jgi:hypothetical protein